MQFAIIETGGKQYIASKDAVIRVEIFSGCEIGKKVTFDKVLLTDDEATTKLGLPHVAGAKVTAEVIGEGRAPKVTVIRYRPKSRYFKKKGHRQNFVTLKINSIS